MKRFYNRIYSDYLLRNRLYVYESILQEIVEKKYSVLTVKSFFYSLKNKSLPETFVILRHDIDTDIQTGEMFLEIERRSGLSATYYLRKTTADTQFAKKIMNSGGEVGYHFEEISELCKKNGIQTWSDVCSNIDLIQRQFKQNLLWFRRTTGSDSCTVASHGDFINRYLGISNRAFLDRALYDDCDIIGEAYDNALIQSLDYYVSDCGYPNFYKTEPFTDALKKSRRICFLTHPRHWRCSRKINTKDNVNRMVEDVLWRLRGSARNTSFPMNSRISKK